MRSAASNYKNLTTHTNIPFCSLFNPPLLKKNKNTHGICAHTHTYTHTPTYKYSLASSLCLLKIKAAVQFGLDSKSEGFYTVHRCGWGVRGGSMSSPTALDVKQKLPEYGWKFGNQLLGSLCHVPQSKVHAEISRTKLMESPLPLTFHWEKYARGEKWGEGMRILFG